jgi:hypothetical protein
MADDSARVSDRELIERMRAGRNDGSVALWLLVPLVTVPVGIKFGEQAALVAVLGSLALCVLLLRIRDRMPRQQASRLAEREYKRRFRLFEVSDYEAEAVASLRKPGAPEVIMLFSGDGLPHGIHHFVRIDLGDEPRLQIRRAPLPGDVLEAETPESQLFRFDQPLSAAQEERVIELLATLTPEVLVPPNRFTFDGFPCSAVILRRGRDPLFTELNMAELPSELYEHPSAKLLRLFIELEAEVS